MNRRKRKAEKCYLVLEVSLRSSSYIGRVRISKDDTLSASIYNILKKCFEVI